MGGKKTHSAKGMGTRLIKRRRGKVRFEAEPVQKLYYSDFSAMMSGRGEKKGAREAAGGRDQSSTPRLREPTRERNRLREEIGKGGESHVGGGKKKPRGRRGGATHLFEVGREHQ